MFGPGLGTVFKNRWRALWLAASILLLAYCSVPSRDETIADQRVKALAPASHANPWSK